MKKPLARPAASIPAAGRRGLHANQELSRVTESLFQQEGGTGRVRQQCPDLHEADLPILRNHVRLAWQTGNHLNLVSIAADDPQRL
jgi:hypothetical protein